MKSGTGMLILSALLIIAGAMGIWLWQSRTEAPLPRSAKTETEAVPPSPASDPTEAPAEIKPARLRFGPGDGQTLAFRFESQSDAETDFAFITPEISGADAGNVPQKSARTPIRMKASGELYLKYFALEPGRWQVAALIDKLDYQINDQASLYEAAVKCTGTFRMKSETKGARQ